MSVVAVLSVVVCCVGLFSCIMRDLANMPTDAPKWIVLDGDIDPMWIESLNTVMDDNKAREYQNTSASLPPTTTGADAGQQ